MQEERKKSKGSGVSRKARVGQNQSGNGEKKAKAKALAEFKPRSELFKRNLLAAIWQAKLMKVGDGYSTLKLKDPNLLTVQIRRKDIPYWGARFSKGTQAPTIRLYFTPTSVVTTAGGTVDQVVQIQAANLLNFTDLAAVFDEYRFVGGEMVYTAALFGSPASATSFLAVGVIDYGDTTALGSYTGAAPYDTKKRFNIVVDPVSAKSASISWPVLFERLPDQEWIPAATTNTTVASLKLVTFATTSLNAQTTGVVEGWIDLQFRGSD